MKLFYFTYCYPYGMGEEWKANELRELVKKFDRVTVVPFYYGGNFDKPKTLPAGVQSLAPLFRDMANMDQQPGLGKILSNRKFPGFLKEFVSKKIFLSKRKLISWLSASRHVIHLLEHPVVKEIIRSGDRDTVLYFYWGKGPSEMLPFIDNRRFKMTFVRMHRFDLFEYVNNNYIPYRGQLLNKISVAAPTSVAGKEHLEKKYPRAKAKIEVFRCGTNGNGKKSNASTDQVLRVVSCSGLSPVKRVHLMIESLQHIHFPILWTHLGEGQLSADLRELSQQLGVQDRFIFKGMVPTEEVINYYTGHEIDLFVNTSSSEGVPFSIMEAFSAGIPVMATDAGGTGEIVDDIVGKLLPNGITPALLAENLKTFYELSVEKKWVLRNNAYERYMNECNAKKLATELGEFLTS